MKKKIFIVICFFMVALMIVSALPTFEKNIVDEYIYGSAGNGSSSDTDNSFVTPVVTLLDNGEAYGSFAEANWHLYEVGNDTEITVFYACTSPVDFSEYMENGKVYYVVVDSISGIYGSYQSNISGIRPDDEGDDVPGGDNSGTGEPSFGLTEADFTLTFDMSGVATVSGKTEFVYDVTYHLFTEGGELINTYYGEGLSKNFGYQGTGDIEEAMGYRYFVVADVCTTDHNMFEITSEVVQFD